MGNFHQIDKAFPEGYIRQLKEEERRMKKWFLGIASGVTLLVLGLVAVQKRKSK